MERYEQDQIDIEELVLVNYKGEEKDILKIFQTFNFEEDIFMSCMVGEIVIVEMHDFQQNFPIIGEEKLRIKYRTTPEMPLVSLEWSVYVMKGKMEVGNAMFGYRLGVCSTELLKSRASRITNIASLKNPVETVGTVLRDFLGSKKPLISDPVKNAVTYISPRLNPIEFINALTPRALSESTGTFSYLFFENTKGFNFRCLDVMKQATPKRYTFQRKAGFVIGQNEFNVIQKFSIEEQNNVLERHEYGGYGANVMLFDPINRRMVNGSFSYFDEKNYKQLTKMSGSSKKLSFHSSEFDLDSPAKTMLLPLTDRNIGRAQRITSINSIEFGIKMIAEIQGNSDLCAGDVLDIEMPSPTGEDVLENEVDRFLAGKWLVVAVKNETNGKIFKQVLQLAKDSFSDDHERVDLTKRITG